MPRGIILPTDREENGGNGTVGMEFDCVVQESPEYIATPTNTALEGGANATNHIKVEATKLSLDIIITSTPNQYLSTVNLNTDGVPDIVRQADEKMQSLRGKVVDIVVGLKTYKSMTLVSYTPSRNVRKANALHFTALFQEIMFVSTETTVVQLKHHPKSAHPKQSVGKQTTETPPAPEQKLTKSWLASGIDSFGLGK